MDYEWIGFAMDSLRTLCEEIMIENKVLFSTLKKEEKKYVNEKLSHLSSLSSDCFQQITNLKEHKRVLEEERFRVLNSVMSNISFEKKNSSFRVLSSFDTKKVSVSVGYTFKEEDGWSVQDVESLIQVSKDRAQDVFEKVIVTAKDQASSSIDYFNSIIRSIEETDGLIRSKNHEYAQSQAAHSNEAERIHKEVEEIFSIKLLESVGDHTMQLIESYDAIAKEWNAGKGAKCEHCGQVQKVDEEKTVHTYARGGAREPTHYTFGFGGAGEWSCDVSNKN